MILFPLWFYFLYNNLYAISVIRNQVANSNKNLVTLYMQMIDNRLNSAEKYLANDLSYDYNLQNMQYGDSQYKQDTATTMEYQKISNDISAYDYINCVFVYATNTKEYFSVYGLENVPYNIKQATDDAIRKLIDSTAAGTITGKGFFPMEINDKYYILRILNDGNLYIGAWISADSMQVPLNLINFGENGTSLFVTSDGKPMNNIDFVNNNRISLNGGFSNYYISGTKSKYLVVGEKSSYQNFSLVALIPDKSILENLGYFQQIAIVTAVSFILLILIYMLFISRSFNTPMSKIINVMARIHAGDIDQRITFQSKSDEFTAINDTFNSMMDQIKELKISVYEEQLATQREELEHLQLQISPHFFMNSLYIIYGLAQVKNFKLVQEMSMCLIKYFEYISRKNMKLVKLVEEIQHIRNYIRIQELRYPNGFTYDIQAPDNLMDILVPPLVIQTFIENIIKYALTMDAPIHMGITVSPAELRNGSGGVRISICNTGSRIDDDVLEQLRAGKRITDERGEHIGIWNIQRRLELIYSGNSRNFVPKHRTQRG